MHQCVPLCTHLCHGRETGAGNLALVERTQILAEHLGVVDKVLRVREGIGIVRLGLETCSGKECSREHKRAVTRSFKAGK